MDTLNTYLEKWGLSIPEELAKTKTSHLYTVVYEGERAVLKIYTDFGQPFEAEGPEALRHFQGNGAIRVYKSDAHACLVEYVDASDLYDRYTMQGDDSAAAIICEVLRKLHSADPADGQKFDSLEKRFQSLFARAKQPESDSLFKECMTAAEKLVATQSDRCVLHGDVHHRNIMLSTKRGWLAIDPNPLYGERTFDFCNAFYNPYGEASLQTDLGRVERLATTFADYFGVNRQRILQFAFAYGGLSSSWHLDDGEDPSRNLAITKLIRGLL